MDVDPSSSTCAPYIDWSIREMALQIVGIRPAADDNTAMVSNQLLVAVSMAHSTSHKVQLSLRKQ